MINEVQGSVMESSTFELNEYRGRSPPGRTPTEEGKINSSGEQINRCRQGIHLNDHSK